MILEVRTSRRRATAAHPRRTALVAGRAGVPSRWPPVAAGRAIAMAAAALLLAASAALGQAGRLTVRVDRPGVRISPMFYGLMTEEINHAYDGGLYAELV